MSANKTTYARNAVLNTHLPNTGRYLALFVTDPTISGTGGTEVSGGSYARQAITFATSTVGQKANTNAITFTSLPSTSISYWAIYDAATGGNMIYTGPLSIPVTMSLGGSFPVPIGNLIIVEE